MTPTEPGKSCCHKIHPDRQSRSSSGLLVAERFLLIESHPYTTGYVGGKTDEPGICKIIRSAGLARNGVFQASRRNAGTVQHYVAQHRYHSTSRALADDVLNNRIILFEYPAIVVCYLHNVVGHGTHTIVGKRTVGRSVFQQSQFYGSYCDR